MNKDINIREIISINEKLQSIDPAFLSASPQQCYEVAIWCASQKSYTGEQMAAAKKQWMDAKKKAYETFDLSNEANHTRIEKYGVMVIKDYINAKCGDFESTYTWIERTNNALGSMEDVLRSVISAIKQEMYSSQRV